MSPATRAQRPQHLTARYTPAHAILTAAAAVCEVHGAHHLVSRLEALISELNDLEEERHGVEYWAHPHDQA